MSPSLNCSISFEKEKALDPSPIKKSKHFYKSNNLSESLTFDIKLSSRESFLFSKRSSNKIDDKLLSKDSISMAFSKRSSHKMDDHLDKLALDVSSKCSNEKSVISINSLEFDINKEI